MLNRISHDLFELSKPYIITLQQKDDVFNVRIESSIQLAERDTVWIEDVHAQRTALN